MKTLKNLLLVLALTTTLAIADDGHTGNGNRCDTCPPCTENCLTDGGQSGTESNESITKSEGETEDYTTVEYWTELFFGLIGYGEF
ncbi:MAG TPA: hypothetical protein VFZ49_00025 [Pyrinomonadaceae bacterium]